MTRRTDAGLDERGQATVDLALSLPFLALLLAALVEIGGLAVDQTRLWSAAREAARVAVVDPDPIAAERAAEAAGPAPVKVEIHPGPEARVQGGSLVVRLEHHHRGRLPLLGRVFDRVLTAAATMRIERP